MRAIKLIIGLLLLVGSGLGALEGTRDEPAPRPVLVATSTPTRAALIDATLSDAPISDLTLCRWSLELYGLDVDLARALFSSGVSDWYEAQDDNALWSSIPDDDFDTLRSALLSFGSSVGEYNRSLTALGAHPHHIDLFEEMKEQGHRVDLGVTMVLRSIEQGDYNMHLAGLNMISEGLDSIDLEKVKSLNEECVD